MPSIQWKTVNEYEDITYKKCNGVARIAFNRPRQLITTGDSQKIWRFYF